MKLAFAAILGLGLLAAPTAVAGPAIADGEALYATRCAMCHDAGVGGAPATDKLKTDTPESILEKLTTGTMAPMAAGISDENKRDIAMFLTGADLPAAAGAADAGAGAAVETTPPAPAEPETTAEPEASPH